MKLVNLTPHAATIHGGDASVTIPASGAVARCTVTSKHLHVLHCDHVAIPVATSVLGPVTDLPESSHGVAYVVSRIVAEACPDRADLYFPGEAIRDAGGRIVGCHGLCRIGGE